MSSSAGEDFEPTAWSWVAHVRAGGSTPWLRWVQASPGGRGGASSGGPPADLTGGPLPGAAQLEFVRRLAARWQDPSATDFGSLADVVLLRSGPGRGLAQLPLLWPGAEEAARVGAPPTDPARVPRDELVRVGTGALVDLLQRPGPPATTPARRPRRSLRSRNYRLGGAPVTASTVRAALARAGHPEGGRSPEVVLFVPPVHLLMAQIWSARVQRGASVRWAAFVARWAGRRALPPSADIPVIAARWRDVVGPERVHLVVCEGGRLPRRTTAEILGLPTPEPSEPEIATLSAAGVDVVRRVNRLLNVRLPEEQQPGVVHRLTRLLAPRPDGVPATGAAEEAPEPWLAIPARHQEWARDLAGRTSGALRGHGYAVHGDLELVARYLPRDVGAPTHPHRVDVLSVLLDTCLAAAPTS